MSHEIFSPRWCFERRVELAGLIGGVGFLFYLLQPQSIVASLAAAAHLPVSEADRFAWLVLAFVNIVASILRIWAGGTLGGLRMMAVHVQTDRFIVAGPYRYVRNPIYLADILTLGGMALVVPWLGSLLVWCLLLAVYPRIIAHEEKNLESVFGEDYRAFIEKVPRLGWGDQPYDSGDTKTPFSLWEGLTNNFIYLPLVPGFLVCAWTGVLWHGVAVGALGPIGWTALHFWRNYKKDGLARTNQSKDR